MNKRDMDMVQNEAESGWVDLSRPLVPKVREGGAFGLANHLTKLRTERTTMRVRGVSQFDSSVTGCDPSERAPRIDHGKTVNSVHCLRRATDMPHRERGNRAKQGRSVRGKSFGSRSTQEQINGAGQCWVSEGRFSAGQCHNSGVRVVG